MIYFELDVPSEYVETEKTRQIQEIKRRMQSYLATDNMNYLDSNRVDNNATVIFVDDGVASGATFIVAARWLRKFYHPNRIIVAASVAPKETVRILEDEEIDVEIITKPQSTIFSFVGQYYQDFTPVTDEQVIQIMKMRSLLHN